MVKQWRNGSRNTLYARTIHRVEFPKLVEAMSDDFLSAQITDTGIEWRVCGYKVTQREVARAWGLSHAQMLRLKDYIYEKDPFYVEG